MNERCRQIERSIIKDFRKTIWKPFIRGLNEYQMLRSAYVLRICLGLN